MPNTLLVTGAAGFIGANFVHYWRAHHPNDTVIAVDALTYAGNRANLAALEDDEAFHFVHANICDTDTITHLLREHEVDTLVHFAAESHVDRSISGPDAFIETNIVGTHSLLKAAKKVWLDGEQVLTHRFHHVSTDEVYGTLDSTEPAFTEQHLYQPNSPYSASKAASDHLVRAYHHTYGLQVSTSNCSNNYGPFHFPEKLIPLCLTNILRGLPLPIYGTGENVRDWLYVEDHCKGIALILKEGVVGETYNIGGNNEWTNIAIIRQLCESLDQRFASDPALAARFPDSPCARGENADSLIRFISDRAGHDWRYAIDASKMTEELGYSPKESFASGLEKTIDWYLAHQEWWQPLLQG